MGRAAFCRKRAAPWTTLVSVRDISVSGKERIQSDGIRYSNMVPVHESSTAWPKARVCVRPSLNQLSCRMSPLATAR